MAIAKKAAIEMQFNWIFIIIAGAVLLAFFFIITQSQRESSKINADLKILQHTDTVLKNIEQSSLNSDSTIVTLGFPKTAFQISCGEVSELSIQDSGYAVSLKNQAVFSPKNLEGSKINAWIVNYNIPYKVMPFVYLTAADRLFVFVNDSNSGGKVEQLFYEFSANFSSVLVNDISSVPEGYDTYVYVTYSTTSNTPNINPSNPKYLIIHIKPDSGSDYDGVGNVQFYKTGEAVPHAGFAYLKKESVFGAMFSEDGNFYKCTMEKVFTRAKYVNTLHADRAIAIQKNMTNTVCEPVYVWPVYYLHEMKSMNFSSMPDYYDNLIKLEKGNKDLAKLSCPLLY
ncbi:hypothetical protein C4573_01215 [Candidatus Woesearchaeota archaeon]|nr:MAG: hypothetical protein C4573_01215 [Candidatus Woesearchaeota archaeon]